MPRAELRFPLAKRGLANTVPTAELAGVRAGFRLFDDADDLGHGKPGFTHLSDSRRGNSPLSLRYYLGLRSEGLAVGSKLPIA